jgi:hypothetical protein
MLERERAVHALRSLLGRRPVVRIHELAKVLKTRSRMSVFRRLKEVGYRSSFTHAGRYYTQADRPRFDDQGLWFHGAIGFARTGTLKATLAAWIPAADAGRTRAELEGVLRVRVANPLRDLLREQRIGWVRWAGQRLYVSAEPRRAAAQQARREERDRRAEEALPPLAGAVAVEVLAEALRMSRVRIDPAVIAARVAARGLAVTVAQVQQLCRRYGLRTLKKTAGSASPRSPR